MRALKTVLAIACGATAFFFLVMSGSGGASGATVGIGGFVLFALLAFLFGRKTKADVGRIERQRQRSEEWSTAIGDVVAERETREPDQGQKVKGVLVGATVLHVLAAPILMLRDLLKMQK